MSKWCYNYDSGEYEYIDRNGYSLDQGEYVYNRNDGEYRREEEELERKREEEENACFENMRRSHLF